MTDRVAYWLELAEYDLETARAMLDTGRYLYVGFMCHQVIEKSLKGYYVQVGGQVPLRTHDLENLANQSGLLSLVSADQRTLLQVLNPLNLEARYPADRARMAKAMTEQRCKELLKSTEELHKWIKQQL